MLNYKYYLTLTIFNKAIFRLLTVVGNTLTLIGCFGLLFGLGGLVRLDDFAIGLSSGIRVVGMVAIAGCLLSAIGYSSLDYIDK